MPMKDQEGLLTMMERGEFTSTKVRNTQTVKANVVIFATSNSTNSFVSVENRQQRHKGCLENCQVMQSSRYRRRYKQTHIHTSEVPQDRQGIQLINIQI